MSTIERVRAATASPAPVAVGMTGAVVAAVLAIAARLPFLTDPLGPDEGGFLLVASQWSPGRSLYGDYFVDRPPGLIAIYDVAGQLGGAVPLRVLGAGAVVVAVLLAGRLGRTPPAALCAALLSTPLFGSMEINGELLAVPFVLASAALVLRAFGSGSGTDRHAAAAGAGAAAASAAAALVKQNMIDGVVVAVVVLVAMAIERPLREAALCAAALVAGAVAASGIALASAESRGTSPRALWDALVTFRAQAAAVIHASAPATTSERLHTMLLAGLAAGVPAVLVAAACGRRRQGADGVVLWAAIAALAWESASALLGGSYWLHYLIVFVPGLVLLVTAVEGRWVAYALRYVAFSAAVAVVGALLHPIHMDADAAVSAYIRGASRPGDTMVVAFGHPNIVADAGLQSPYDNPWSLPVRVRDPHLDGLAAVLRGSAAPRWVVVDGRSLATWGVDPAAAQHVLDTEYRLVDSAGGWHVFEHE
ncbi:hypothetical protein GON03_05535 [Nocardioides sp. MAH-18]|uniref:Glycosyltransferase RgtA/B/C/D-like domain-containing protein n=1 Tax=Nocardioides agri TaxID=2682843 RepID=A0A6L6XSN0_9ACTN|nr:MULTISPECIES: hypothetical protein [unclassified Nocardioides]MBA2953770.1 hypothetical protein [Nocardioides sp. CGMCC 1.13656]MVQ48635.1 hypothetical protein [Nocardioides sp. MAH-18]